MRPDSHRLTDFPVLNCDKMSLHFISCDSDICKDTRARKGKRKLRAAKLSLLLQSSSYYHFTEGMEIHTLRNLLQDRAK